VRGDRGLQRQADIVRVCINKLKCFPSNTAASFPGKAENTNVRTRDVEKCTPFEERTFPVSSLAFCDSHWTLCSCTSGAKTVISTVQISNCSVTNFIVDKANGHVSSHTMHENISDKT
jgi:hypothetical protein